MHFTSLINTSKDEENGSSSELSPDKVITALLILHFNFLYINLKLVQLQLQLVIIKTTLLNYSQIMPWKKENYFYIIMDLWDHVLNV